MSWWRIINNICVWNGTEHAAWYLLEGHDIREVCVSTNVTLCLVCFKKKHTKYGQQFHKRASSTSCDVTIFPGIQGASLTSCIVMLVPHCSSLHKHANWTSCSVTLLHYVFSFQQAVEYIYFTVYFQFNKLWCNVICPCIFGSTSCGISLSLNIFSAVVGNTRLYAWPGCSLSRSLDNSLALKFGL